MKPHAFKKCFNKNTCLKSKQRLSEQVHISDGEKTMLNTYYVHHMMLRSCL